MSCFFSSLSFSITALDHHIIHQLSFIITNGGGTLSRSLSRTTTHLIVPNSWSSLSDCPSPHSLRSLVPPASATKLLAAAKWNIPIVSVQWIYKCHHAQMILDTLDAPPWSSNVACLRAAFDSRVSVNTSSSSPFLQSDSGHPHPTSSDLNTTKHGLFFRCAFMAEEFNSFRRDRLRSLVTEHNGVFVDDAFSDLSPISPLISIWILVIPIVCMNLDSIKAKYINVLTTGKFQVVSDTWVQQCLLDQTMYPLDKSFLFTPHQQSGINGFCGKLVSTTGFGAPDTMALHSLLTALGSTVCPNLTNKCHVLICRRSQGTKFDKAKEWGVPTVSIGWLETAIRTHTYPTIDQFRIRPFTFMLANTVLCFTSRVKALGRAFRRIAEMHGAQVLLGYARKCTHVVHITAGVTLPTTTDSTTRSPITSVDLSVVSEGPSDRELRLAQSQGKFIVSPWWIMMSVQVKERLRESEYPPSFDPHRQLSLSNIHTQPLDSFQFRHSSHEVARSVRKRSLSIPFPDSTIRNPTSVPAIQKRHRAILTNVSNIARPVFITSNITGNISDSPVTRPLVNHPLGSSPSNMTVANGNNVQGNIKNKYLWEPNHNDVDETVIQSVIDYDAIHPTTESPIQTNHPSLIPENNSPSQGDDSMAQELLRKQAELTLAVETMVAQLPPPPSTSVVERSSQGPPSVDSDSTDAASIPPSLIISETGSTTGSTQDISLPVKAVMTDMMLTPMELDSLVGAPPRISYEDPSAARARRRFLASIMSNHDSPPKKNTIRPLPLTGGKSSSSLSSNVASGGHKSATMSTHSSTMQHQTMTPVVKLSGKQTIDLSFSVNSLSSITPSLSKHDNLHAPAPLRPNDHQMRPSRVAMGNRNCQPRVALSGLINERAEMETIIRDLGGCVVNDEMVSSRWVSGTTHLVILVPITCEKCMCAIASGAWLLRPSWIKASQSAGHWVDEMEHSWAAITDSHQRKLAVQEAAAGTDKFDFVKALEVIAGWERWHHMIHPTNRSNSTLTIGAFQGWRVLLVSSASNSSYHNLLLSGGATLVDSWDPTSDPDAVTHVLLHQGKLDRALSSHPLVRSRIYSSAIVMPHLLGENPPAPALIRRLSVRGAVVSKNSSISTSTNTKPSDSITPRAS